MNTVFDRAIQKIGRLPGLGPRSARRILLYLIRHKHDILYPLIHELDQLITQLKTCTICHNMDISDPCQICDNPNRLRNQLCIVSDINDLWAIEKTGVYGGKYHVLGGVLSAVQGIGPDQLQTKSLIQRMENEDIHEIIIALNPTLDGQVTVGYINDLLKKFDCSISTLAHGVPLGAELEYIDDGTLSLAFRQRTQA